MINHLCNIGCMERGCPKVKAKMKNKAEYSRMVDMVIYDRASVEDCIDNKIQAMILALAILDQAGCAVTLTRDIAEQLGVAEEWGDLPYEEP